MSAVDVKHAKEALAWRLKELGVANPHQSANEFIDELVARGWVMDPNRESRPAPPKAGEFCVTCCRRLEGCICGERATQPPKRSELTAQHIATLRAQHAQAARDALRGTTEGTHEHR